MKKLLSLLLAVVFAACSLSIVSAEPVDVPTKEGVGMNVMGFNTTDLEGNPYDSSILQNADLTFINYWATWCGPCRSEMPHIQAMHEYYSGTPEADVQFIGVISESNGCTPATALAFLNQNGYTWLNLRADSVLRSVFNTSGYIPQTLIVDRNGVVRDHIVGSFSNANELRNTIEMWLDVFNNHEGEECTVTYVNGITGETIAETTVGYGYPVPDNYPNAPEMEGYSFANWTASGDIYQTGYETIYNIAMGDITFTANYNVQKYRVRFYDGVNGNLINVQQVEYGQAATPPAHPEHEGYTFMGWDVDINCITENTDVHGICVPDSELEPTPEPGDDPIPGDVNGNGTLEVADAVEIARAALGLQQIDEAIADFDGNGRVEVADATLVIRAALGL